MRAHEKMNGRLLFQTLNVRDDIVEVRQPDHCKNDEFSRYAPQEACPGHLRGDSCARHRLYLDQETNPISGAGRAYGAVARARQVHQQADLHQVFSARAAGRRIRDRA